MESTTKVEQQRLEKSESPLLPALQILASDEYMQTVGSESKVQKSRKRDQERGVISDEEERGGAKGI